MLDDVVGSARCVVLCRRTCDWSDPWARRLLAFTLAFRPAYFLPCQLGMRCPGVLAFPLELHLIVCGDSILRPAQQ